MMGVDVLRHLEQILVLLGQVGQGYLAWHFGIPWLTILILRHRGISAS